MAERQPPARRRDDATAMLQSLLPGLTWTPAMLDQAGRAQAALAAETLHRFNAPLEQAMAQHREFAETLSTAAKQLAALAKQVGEMAETYAQLNKNLELSVAPYLRYVEQLDAYGAGKSGTPG